MYRFVLKFAPLSAFRNRPICQTFLIMASSFAAQGISWSIVCWPWAGGLHLYHWPLWWDSWLRWLYTIGLFAAYPMQLQSLVQWPWLLHLSAWNFMAIIGLCNLIPEVDCTATALFSNDSSKITLEFKHIFFCFHLLPVNWLNGIRKSLGLNVWEWNRGVCTDLPET